MPNLRQRATCVGLGASFSILSGFFGFFRGVVPPDPLAGRVSVSLLDQMNALGGRRMNLNVIATGSDNFTDADNIEVDYAIFKLRNVYRQASLGVGRVQHWAVSGAEANGLDAPTSEGQLQELTERWEVPNDGIDLFIVHDINIASNGGSLLGRSAVDGPCLDKDQKGMEAATAGLWGSEQTARTVAHELGHYLTLGHRNDEPDNLMCQSGKASSTRNSTVLTSGQGSDMRGHCLTSGGCDFLEITPERYSIQELRAMVFENRGPLAPVLALATLRRKDYPEAEKLADLRRAARATELDPRARRAALLELGRMGGPAAMRVLQELGPAANTPALALARAEGLRLLGSIEPGSGNRPLEVIARLRETATRTAVPTLGPVKRLVPRRPVPIKVQLATSAQVERATQALAAIGLQAASGFTVHLDCLGREHMLALSTEAANGVKRLSERATPLGALLTKHDVEVENWSPSVFLFSQPAIGKTDATLEIIGLGYDGAIVLNGAGVEERGQYRFSLHATEVPGNVPVEIEGVLSAKSVEITRAVSDAVPTRARLPRPR